MSVFGSWGTQNQQQQPQQPQPQQQPGVFGQPSAFGGAPTTNAFGSTAGSAFGQPQAQANPMFGAATPAAPATGTGFGGFGSTNTAGTGGFGGASVVKPASGFGAFGGGGTSAFGSGASAFGQPAATTTTAPSVFGQPAATATATVPSSGFGVFGSGNKFGAAAPSAPTSWENNGTLNPGYTTTTEKDQASVTTFNSITCMPAYAGWSFEELRCGDYKAGRKVASATTSTFGGASAFGSTQPAGGLFGAQAAPATATPSLFGSTPAAAPSAFGSFGQPQTTNPNPLMGGTTGAFGAQPAAGGFGSTTTGTFGQPQNSAFGGAAAPKPGFGGFGTTPGTTGGFGTTSTPAFGQAQQQQQPQQGQSGGLFGAAQPAASTGNGFGGFGSAASTAAKPSIFGAPAATTQPAAPAFGGFGTTPGQNQPQQAQTTSLFGGGGLFGNTQQQQQQQQPQQQASTGLFGQPAATSGATGGGLFGNAGGGGLFGNTQAQQQPQQNQAQSNPFGGLFNKPAQPATTTNSLFGGGLGQSTAPAQTQGGGLFGGGFGQSTTQGSSLFGKPAAPPLGTSMSTSQAPNGLFGASTAQQQQPSLTASIAQPIGENLPIFSLLPPGPRIIDLPDSPKKKAGFFVDIPTRSVMPRVPVGYTPASSKLRGFGNSVMASSTSGNPFNASVMAKPGALSLDKSSNRSMSLGPDGLIGRSGSPALGSGGHQSVKKVILDKKVEPSDLFVKTISPGGSRQRITFSPQLSVTVREADSAPAPAQVEPPTPAPKSRHSRFTAQQIKEPTADGEDGDLEEGDYWVKPNLAALKKAGYDQLSAFPDLVVGRKGYGEIRFLEPVDLTGLPKLGALLGEVIKFADKECSVYPESDDAEKPPPGSGLNVEARLILERCWAVDKATREPIKDASHPSAAKHLKRLKNMKDTHFESFDIKTGTWTFTVDHF